MASRMRCFIHCKILIPGLYVSVSIWGRVTLLQSPMSNGPIGNLKLLLAMMDAVSYVISDLKHNASWRKSHNCFTTSTASS